MTAPSSASLTILREFGPARLDDLTGATAKWLGFGSMTYADVDAVMRGHLERGEAARDEADDFRATVWRAT